MSQWKIHDFQQKILNSSTWRCKVTKWTFSQHFADMFQEQKIFDCDIQYQIDGPESIRIYKLPELINAYHPPRWTLWHEVDIKDIAEYKFIGHLVIQDDQNDNQTIISCWDGSPVNKQIF